MASSPIIEFLQTLKTPGGGALLQTAVEQVIIPAFPPATRVVIVTTPVPRYVATIGYRTTVNIVPNAFRLEFTQSGFKPLEGLLTSDSIAHGADYFFVSTEGENLIITLVNESVLNQRYESNSYFLGIVGDAELQAVNEALRRVNMPVAALEALEAVRKMANKILETVPG